MEDPLIDLTFVKPFGGLNDLMSIFIVLLPLLELIFFLKFVLIVVPTVVFQSHCM